MSVKLELIATNRVPVELNRNGNIPVPTGLPDLTTAMLHRVVKKNTCRDPELKRIQRLHDGDPNIIHDTGLFPAKDGMEEAEWAAYKRLMVYVNLVKPAVRRLVSGTYGGSVLRTVAEGSWYKVQLEELFSPSTNYRHDSRCWFENAALFGTSVRCWWYNREQELESWIPNPIYTHIEVDPYNLKRALGVFEFSPDGDELRFATAEGWGVIRKQGSTDWMAANLGFVPFTVGYGHDRTHRGEKDGLSLVREAPDYSIRVTDIMGNLSFLQKVYSRAQGVVEGGLISQDPAQFGLHGMAEVEKGGKFYYASPEAKFAETLSVARQYIATLAIILSIPQDAFDASAIEPNQSAESAKMRNVPLSSLTAFLIEEWRRNEIDFAMRGAAMMRYVESKNNPVNFSDIRKFVKVNLEMEPASVPLSLSEEVAAWIQLVQYGGKTPQDFARHFNDNKSEPELSIMAEFTRQVVDAMNAPKPAPSIATA